MAGPGQKIKGNPASHRMGNANLKARRERCWGRQQKRKDARRIEQDARAKRNVQLRSLGQPTAWEVACAERRARRDVLRQAGQLARSAHS